MQARLSRRGIADIDIALDALFDRLRSPDHDAERRASWNDVRHLEAAARSTRSA